MVDKTDPLVLHQAMLGKLYDTLTGPDINEFEKTGSFFTWLAAGMPVDPSEWDFMSGIIHPPVVETLVMEEEVEEDSNSEDSDKTDEDKDDKKSDADNDKGSTGGVKTKLVQMEFTKADARRFAIRSAATFYHLVDFIPAVSGFLDAEKLLSGDEGTTRHATTLGASITKEYERVLRECELAEVRQSEENKKKIEDLTKLLEKTVEVKDENGNPVIDPLSGEPMTMTMPSHLMKSYNTHRAAAEAAELELRGLRVDGMTSEDPSVVMKANQFLPLKQAKFGQAKAMWDGVGMKNQIETWQAEIARLAPQTIVSYWQKLVARLDSSRVEDPEMGEYFFCSLMSPMILRSGGWTAFSLSVKDIKSGFDSFKQRTSGSLDLPMSNVIPISLEAEGESNVTSTGWSNNISGFNIKFSLAEARIVRPHIDVNFLMNNRWRLPKGSEPLSTGGPAPKGSLPALPTHIVVIKDLELTFDELKAKGSHFHQHLKKKGGMKILGMNFGAQAKREKSRVRNRYSFDEEKGTIRVEGAQIIGFRNQLLGQAPDPDPAVKNWIAPDLDVA